MKGDDMKDEQKKKKGFFAMLRESIGKTRRVLRRFGSACGPSEEGEKAQIKANRKRPKKRARPRGSSDEQRFCERRRQVPGVRRVGAGARRLWGR